VRQLVIALFLFTFTLSASAQKHPQQKAAAKKAAFKSAEQYFPLAKAFEKAIYSLAPARKVVLMDATPDASHWYIADEFAHWQQMTIDGQTVEHRFHEIFGGGTRLSPNGDFVIWTGLMHAYTQHGFDSTVTYLYKDLAPIDHYLAEFPTVEFSASGKRWAALLPYAYETQEGDRDFVIVDGLLAHKGEVAPHQFSFSHDEKHWAYRATDGLIEKLVTDRSDTSIFLYKRAPLNNGVLWDPTIWRYTPDVTYNHRLFQGRDYDFSFAHVARLGKTSYSSASDTSHVFINFADQNQPLYRWVSDVHIDDSGRHIAYFAASPTVKSNEPARMREAIMVYDGKPFGPVLSGIGRVFMSPSGKHIAYSTDAGDFAFFLDGKQIAKTSRILDCIWTPDESRIVFSALGEHEKAFVVANGKRSALFERIGRIGFSSDGKAIEFAGIRNSKLYKVRMALK
jgi:hypothetical protein